MNTISGPAPNFNTARILPQTTYFCKNCDSWYLTLGSTWVHYHWELVAGWGWLNADR